MLETTRFDRLGRPYTRFGGSGGRGEPTGRCAAGPRNVLCIGVRLSGSGAPARCAALNDARNVHHGHSTCAAVPKWSAASVILRNLAPWPFAYGHLHDITRTRRTAGV